MIAAVGMADQPPLALTTLLRGAGNLVGISSSAAGRVVATVQRDGVIVIDAASQVKSLRRWFCAHACVVHHTAAELDEPSFAGQKALCSQPASR